MNTNNKKSISNMVNGKIHVPERNKTLRLGYTCGDCDNMDKSGQRDEYGRYWCGKIGRWVSAGETACNNHSHDR